MATLEQSKAVSRRVIEAINAGDTKVLDDVVSRDLVEHDPPPGVPATREGLQSFLKAFRTAFPDLKYRIDRQIAEGDTVVSYLTGTGTMRGSFQNMPPTNKTGTWHEIHISTIRDGKVVEHWGIVDQLGMLQSLGVSQPVAQAAH